MVDILPKRNQPAAPASVTYPPGVTNPSTSGSTGLPNYVPGGGGTSTPSPSAPVQGPQPTMKPGTDTYEWYALNNALRAAGLDGWQIAGDNHTPVAAGTWVANPSYNKLLTEQENRDAGNGEEFIFRPGADYVIGVSNPQTGQMLKVHFSRSAPDASGNYTYTATGREDQGKLDKAQAGYTGVQRLPFADGHEELWGTNSATGAFEKMPAQPTDLGNLKGWNDVRQVDDGQGHKVWVGTNPQGQPMQPIPGAPTINTDKYVPGSVKQVVVNGKLVYRGQNAQTQQWEDIPELGSEPAKIDTTTVGGKIYKQNPNAGQPGEPDFVPVSGIASPKEGDRQWVDASGGYVKRQEYHNGAWSDVGPDDEEGTWRPVNPATVRAEGAIKPKGTQYWIPVPGSPDTLIQVTADGNGGYTYETPDGSPPKTMKVAGIQGPQTVSGAGSAEFLPAQRDPVTNQLLPAQKNPNWAPTNVADRVRQLTEQAQAKQNDLHQQVVAGQLSEDQANAQFQDWWDSYIAPAKQEIDQAAQQKQQDLQNQQLTAQRQQQEQERLNYSTAMQAGQNAAANVQAQIPYMVGPGFAENLNKIAQGWTSGKPIQGLDLGAMLTFQMPDTNAIAQQVTNQALAHISPTAAQGLNAATGPNVPNFNPSVPQMTPDYTQGLASSSRYLPSNATTTIAPDGTVTINHAPAAPASNAPAPLPSVSAYTPPGGSSYSYPTVPWAGATPQPLPDYMPSF